MDCNHNYSDENVKGVAVDHKVIIWFMTVFFCLLADWWLMKRELNIEYSNSFGTLIKAIGDVCLILAPYWLLTPKWRWTALILVWAAAIWGICNLVYFRFWNDLIPPAAVTMGGNMDSNLVGYGLALLRWRDILFLLPPCLASFILRCVKPKKSPSLRTKIKLGVFCI